LAGRGGGGDSNPRLTKLVYIEANGCALGGNASTQERGGRKVGYRE